MAVAYVGETWGVQRLFRGTVSLASLAECTRHQRRLATRHTYKDKGCTSAFD